MDQGEKLGGGADCRRILYEGTERADGGYWHRKVLDTRCVSSRDLLIPAFRTYIIGL